MLAAGGTPRPVREGELLDEAPPTTRVVGIDIQRGERDRRDRTADVERQRIADSDLVGRTRRSGHPTGGQNLDAQRRELPRIPHDREHRRRLQHMSRSRVEAVAAAPVAGGSESAAPVAVAVDRAAERASERERPDCHLAMLRLGGGGLRAHSADGLAGAVRRPAPLSSWGLHALVGERHPSPPVVGEHDAERSLVVGQPPPLHHARAATDHGHGM